MDKKKPTGVPRTGKADVILMAALLFCGALLFFVRVPSGAGPDDLTVEIRVDGRTVYTGSLAEEGVVEAGAGNRVAIRDGAVFMEEADCPDGSCIRQGRISRSGQAVVCLPNRVVVRITEGKAPAFDTVAE